MVTPKELRDSTRKSGFRYVSVGGGGRGYQGNLNGGNRRKGWRGPLRRTALAAAKDYCNYVNGSGVAHGRLKSAGHKFRPRGTTTSSPAPSEPIYGYVYCVLESGRAKYAKIGFSTDPHARIASLQCGNPRVLKLVGYFPGTIEDERKLHQEFMGSNVLQEWFKATDELLGRFE